MISFQGVVREGDKHGRSIGFPTANLVLDAEIKRQLPKAGVYACLVALGNRTYSGVLFRGKRALFHENNDVCEIYLVDFSGNLYGREISVQVVEYIREPVEVLSDEELRGLIEGDIQKVLNSKFQITKNKQIPNTKIISTKPFGI